MAEFIVLETGYPGAIKQEVVGELIRCKDCRHFEYDHLYVVQGIPVLGHELCNAWGEGCKTSENGYCFLAERKTDETD